MSGNTSVGVRRAASGPMMQMKIANTINVYGLSNAVFTSPSMR